MEGQTSQLQQELRELRAEVAGLRAELTLVRTAVFGEGETDQRFSVIPSAGPSSSTGQTATGDGQPWAEREVLAAKVGRFLRAALTGGHRGESGHKEILAGSRFWIVVRGYSGELYSPVRVFGRRALAERLVKKGGLVGDSVFVGLPSKREVQRAIEAGRFEWSGSVEA